MTAKDFINVKKPHFWTALIAVIVLIFAGVVAVVDKKESVESVDVPVEEVKVEVEEVPDEPKKTDSQIILERFSSMDWEEVKKNAKSLDEEGWEDGIVYLGGLSKSNVALYGYNDDEYKLRGVAVEHNGNVNYFDWTYMSDANVQPQMYWNKDASQLQITLHTYGKDELRAPDLHVLVEHDTGTMEDFVLRASDYLIEIEDQMTGTGTSVGAYVDIKLGKTMLLQFEPVKKVDGVDTALKLHQAIIYLNPSKDGYIFEIGDVGVEPEKRKATIEIDGVEEKYTEIQYISDEGYSIWYPDYILEPYKIHNHEGFVIPGQGANSQVQVILVPEGDMKLTDSYLKEAAGNFKSSGEYKKVTVSKIKTLNAESKDVKIKMIEVVHDDTADRFYIVEGKDQALLVTVSMTKESLEGMGTRISKMLGTITFSEDTTKSE